jgi:RNA polymerase sigma-70 factor (ECF subfamily)
MPEAPSASRLTRVDLREPSTFSRVYAEYAPAVEAIARHILSDASQAQDVTHDVFLRLWTNPEAWDPRRANIGAYLRLLARSRALDVHRSRSAAGRATDRFREVVARTEHIIAAEARDDCAEVRRAVRTLPDPQREAVVLQFWGDLPDHQVARRAGVPLGTAKSRIRLGLRRLRTEMEAA